MSTTNPTMLPRCFRRLGDGLASRPLCVCVIAFVFGLFATAVSAQTSGTSSWRDGIPGFKPVKTSGSGIPDVKPKIFSPRETFQLPSYLYQSRSSVLAEEISLPAEAQVAAAPESTVATAPTVEVAADAWAVPDIAPAADAVSTDADGSVVLPTVYQNDSIEFAPPQTSAVDMAPTLPEPPRISDLGVVEELPSPLPSDGVIGSASIPEGPIGNAIASGADAEQPPLETQTTSWYAVPWRWLRDGWENHAEFGLDGSDGNARTTALQTGLEMKRKTEDYTVSLDIDYRYARNADGATEDSGRFNADYDRLFDDSKWAAFGKYGTEWDRFKVFDLRVNVNGGLSYHWIRTDDSEFVTRFGAGASKEIGSGVPDNEWKAEAVFGVEGERQINRYNKMKAKVEYFPEWANFANYRLVTDLAWEILLDDEDNLSLKLAATDRYDSTPQGGDKANDIYYSLLLLLKF